MDFFKIIKILFFQSTLQYKNRHRKASFNKENSIIDYANLTHRFHVSGIGNIWGVFVLFLKA